MFPCLIVASCFYLESDLAEQLGEEPAGGAQGLGDRTLLQQVGQDLAQDKI